MRHTINMQALYSREAQKLYNCLDIVFSHHWRPIYAHVVIEDDKHIFIFMQQQRLYYQITEKFLGNWETSEPEPLYQSVLLGMTENTAFKWKIVNPYNTKEFFYIILEPRLMSYAVLAEYKSLTKQGFYQYVNKGSVEAKTNGSKPLWNMLRDILRYKWAPTSVTFTPSPDLKLNIDWKIVVEDDDRSKMFRVLTRQPKFWEVQYILSVRKDLDPKDLSGISVNTLATWEFEKGRVLNMTALQMMDNVQGYLHTLTLKSLVERIRDFVEYSSYEKAKTYNNNAITKVLQQPMRIGGTGKARSKPTATTSKVRYNGKLHTVFALNSKRFVKIMDKTENKYKFVNWERT